MEQFKNARTHTHTQKTLLIFGCLKKTKYQGSNAADFLEIIN